MNEYDLKELNTQFLDIKKVIAFRKIKMMLYINRMTTVAGNDYSISIIMSNMIQGNYK